MEITSFNERNPAFRWKAYYLQQKTSNAPDRCFRMLHIPKLDFLCVCVSCLPVCILFLYLVEMAGSTGKSFQSKSVPMQILSPYKGPSLSHILHKKWAGDCWLPIHSFLFKKKKRKPSSVRLLFATARNPLSGHQEQRGREEITGIPGMCQLPWRPNGTSRCHWLLSQHYGC